MAIRIGSVVGDYEVIDKLGSGGIGQVFRVRHTISHRIEALKLLLPVQLATPENTERFAREIRVVASLSHPNIAQLHNAFRHEGELIMIMEFVEGVTLRARLSAGSISVGHSLDYMRQSLAGLAYAHARGVIHRDVKPSNIMISPDQRTPHAELVKLLDFGLAMSERNTELTRTGMVMGSPHYMSPEQVMGERVDARTDIYSVGVTLYQMLTGKPPIDGASDFAIASAHLRDVPVPPAVHDPRLPANLSEVVMKALEKFPSERFQSAEEFLRALEPFHADETLAYIPSPGVARDPGSDRVPRSDPGSSGNKQTHSLTGSAVLAEVSRELAHFIGPIARIIVNRAAARSETLEALYTAVAQEIASDADRRRFLATRNKYSARG
jgi:serine/threonine protein kinase